MTNLSLDQVRTLAQRQGAIHLSVFMPTSRAEGENLQAPLRLRNLLHQAEVSLTASGWRTPDIAALLEPARQLQDEAFFWRHLEDGVAIFLAPSFQRFYQVPLMLEPHVVLGARFQLKPLVPLLNPSGTFYVLALSQNSVRLFRGSRDALEELRPEALPHNLAEVMRLDEYEKAVRFRPGAPVGAGRWSAVVYGGGSGEEVHKQELYPFCRQIDQGLCTLLEPERPPVLLAGVDYLTAIYRAISHYPHLVPETITGSPDHLSPKALHQAALRLLRSDLNREQTEAEALYYRLAHTKRVTNDLRKIVPLAHQGVVQTLFVARDRQVWGIFDPDTSGLHLFSEPAPQGEDLLNLAAMQTLLMGGTVFAIAAERVPGTAPLAAVLRY